MNSPQVGGSGVVLAPGMAPTHGSLADGEYTITIQGLTSDGDSEYVTCAYPGEFVKDHEAKSVMELLPKITNQLRGRFGAMTVEFKTLPGALAEGAQITLEVTNG